MSPPGEFVVMTRPFCVASRQKVKGADPLRATEVLSCCPVQRKKFGRCLLQAKASGPNWLARSNALILVSIARKPCHRASTGVGRHIPPTMTERGGGSPAIPLSSIPSSSIQRNPRGHPPPFPLLRSRGADTIPVGMIRF